MPRKSEFTLQAAVHEAAKKALLIAVERQDARLSASRFADSFIKNWFFPNSLLFIFRESARVTNISYSELLSLIEIHLSPKEKDRHIQFYTSRQIKSYLIDIWENIIINAKEYTDFVTIISKDNNLDKVDNRVKLESAIEKLAQFAQKYFDEVFSDQVNSTILIDPYYTSCVVTLPKNLDLDYSLVVGESGYIVFCGRLIYIRNSSKTSVDELSSKLTNFYNSYNKLDESKDNKFLEKIPLCLYAQEHYDKYELSSERGKLYPGLDILKVPKNKYFFGNIPIADAMDIIAISNSSHYELISGVSHYADEANEFFGSKDSNRVTVFVIRDFEIGETGRRSEKQYVIAYAQLVSNKVPTHIFEENKPGWYGPVTLPHSLATAMINICRPSLVDNNIKIADPFVGSGTTFLETIRHGNRISFIGGDGNPITKSISEDNLMFFSLPAEIDNNHTIKNIEEISNILLPSTTIVNFRGDILSLLALFIKAINLHSAQIEHKFINHVIPRPPQDIDPIDKIVSWCLARANMFINQIEVHEHQKEQSLRRIREFEFKQDFINSISGDDRYFVRLMFYCVWRAFVTNISDYFSSKIDDWTIVTKELNTSLERFYRIYNIRVMQPAARTKFVADHLLEQGGIYSNEIIIPASTYKSAVYKENGFDWTINSPLDAIDLLNGYKEQLDLIITDPPYGFNTDADDGPKSRKLIQLYRDWLYASIVALKNEGQIIFCLPDTSHNGQKIPVFAKKEWVTNEFIKTANKLNVQISLSINTISSYQKLFERPYYWKSQRALTRSILHFKIIRSKETS